MADLYVYFYELGVKLLRPGGRLSFIVTNKWMKAGYGEPLRRFLAENAWLESVVDFGHAKQIFEDADVFPCIIVARKPDEQPKPPVRVCAIPREQLRIDDLGTQIEQEGFEVDAGQLGSEPWQLEPRGVTELLAKVRQRGIPLADFTGVKPLMGIKTGCNDAFLIDTATKNALAAADPKCTEIIQPYLRGQDIARWHPDWAGLWMIALKSSDNYAWPWADAGDDAEIVFGKTYPSLHAHLDKYREPLVRRQDQGRYWWELRSCAYWHEFERPKIVYQDITWRSQFCFDEAGTLSNNTVYFQPNADLWVAAVLNSPIAWWFSWRMAVHGKDEALRFFTVFVEEFPVPRPSAEQRSSVQTTVARLIECSRTQQAATRDLLDWLRVAHGIEKPSLKLQSPAALDSDAFVAEVKKLRGKKNVLTAPALKSLRDEHARSIGPLKNRMAEALDLERQVSDLVNEAYGLTPEEAKLMWQTAPPRMPTSVRS
jgi:hypothetical protein